MLVWQLLHCTTPVGMCGGVVMPGRGGAVVAARAIGVGRLVNVGSARPTGEARRRVAWQVDAVAAAGRDVTGDRRRCPAHPWCPRPCRSRCGRRRSGSRSPPRGSSCRWRSSPPCWCGSCCTGRRPPECAAASSCPVAVVPLWQLEQLVSVAWWT